MLQRGFLWSAVWCFFVAIFFGNAVLYPAEASIGDSFFSISLPPDTGKEDLSEFLKNFEEDFEANPDSFNIIELDYISPKSALRKTSLRLGFNFFVGADAGDMAVSAQGLGSISGLPAGLDNFMVGKPYVLTRKEEVRRNRWKGDIFFYFTPRVGLVASKFRFSEPLVPYAARGEADKIIFLTDADPNRTFDQGFFKRAKSKTVLYSLRLAPEIGAAFGLWGRQAYVGFKPIFEYALDVKHKIKFEESGEKRTKVYRGTKNLNIIPFQYGAGLEVGYEFISLYFNYFASSVFEKDKGPKVRRMEIGISVNPF